MGVPSPRYTFSDLMTSSHLIPIPTSKARSGYPFQVLVAELLRAIRCYPSREINLMMNRFEDLKIKIAVIAIEIGNGKER